MLSVGIKELKNRLTEYLRHVKRGQEVVITERGKPIAVVQRIDSLPETASLDAKLAKLAAQGVLTLPAGKPRKHMPKVRIKGKPLSEVMVEEREERG